MTIITDITAIAETFARFPTSRNLPGQWEQENCQEWAGHGTLDDGTPAKIYHIFTNEEASSEDAGDFPWDADHVSKIEIAEKDEDGEFESL